MATKDLEKLSTLIRYWILLSTTKAGSGHPTSSLSGVELMTALFFGKIFRYDLKNPSQPNNDRIIFSKGHASPLFYALYAAAGKISEKELKTLREFNSLLEGHPTSTFPYSEAATGSLGQGLSIGLGMALNAKYIDKLSYKTYVLLGDSEMSEGSQWEAIQLAAHYKLNNLIGIIDVNRLGQRGQTMYGHNLAAYEKRLAAFGWQTITIDGHSLAEILNAYKKVLKAKNKPTMIIAKTLKGKGISFLENKNGWHGKALSQEQFSKALTELGKIDKHVRGSIVQPKKVKISKLRPKIKPLKDSYEEPLGTRKAYGHALVKLYPRYPNMVVLDAEVSNSTYAKTFKEVYPKRFFEMFIAEQNMVGVAVGLAARGKIPFVSTFSAFFTRAFDQIRMSQYSGKAANIKFVGSHAGTSIGPDGPSQMGLEDIAMFRSLLNSVVLYPADHLSSEKLVEQAIKHKGLVYIRTTRMDTEPIYKKSDTFPIGGSQTLKASSSDKITVIGAGVTLYEALKAYNELKKQKINIRIIDLYSIKPIDAATLKKAAKQTQAILTVEDHYVAGGIGEAVKTALEAISVPIYSLAVKKMPKSGSPEKLLNYENISSQAIVKKVKSILK